MKQEYGLLGASLDGLKTWLPDWSKADVGVERDFNGIRAPWVAQLNMGDKTGVAPLQGESAAMKISGWSSSTSRYTPSRWSTSGTT